MRPSGLSSFRIILLAAVAMVLPVFGFCAARAVENNTVPLHALIVGGGPDVHTNAAQIESHARYVAQLLPAETRRIVLFADGKPDATTVTMSDESPAGNAMNALSVLLPGSGQEEQVNPRKPNLGIPVDGPSSREAIHNAITKLLPGNAVGKSVPPLLLYFAGHGRPMENKEESTQYDLWGNKTFSVHDLSMEIARLPVDAPVVLVMAQCYSGAFANVLLRDGKPQGDRVPQNVVGFFSAKKDRMASGCGWETGEADYQDFSSYFFGALCGYNRFGHAVERADYDGNGTVSLHEAFCYALGHDASIDTPTCTSDIFLRRFAPMPDWEIFETPYANVSQSASPAQRAALDTLSQKLGLDGGKRALAAYDRLKYRDPIAVPSQLLADRAAIDKLNDLRMTTLAMMFKEWPALRWEESPDYARARGGALRMLEANPTLCRKVREAERANDAAEAPAENDEAYLHRFLDLYRSVVLAENLRENAKDDVKANFRRLWDAEQQSLPLSYPHQ